MIKFLYLVIGGAAGTVSRYFLSGAVYRRFGADFPHGTLVVNMAGCFMIGLLAALSDKKFLLSGEFRVLLMVGFCGAFTTFATFMLETDNLLREGQALSAALNVFVSVLAGFALYRAGTFIGEMI